MLDWMRMHFSGWVVIRISGYHKSALLNLALQEGIDFYDIHTLEDGSITARVYFRKIGRLRHLARTAGVTFRLHHRFGVLFFWRYMKKRFMLPVGFLLFVAAIYILSSYALFVQVSSETSLQHVTIKEIETAAAESGIAFGGYIPQMDFRQAEKDMLLKLPELAWVGISRQGSRVEIVVVERKVAEQDPDMSPLLIAAAKDGVIKEVLVMQGLPLVEEGQTVTAGQPLVMPQNGEARAIINARVWYEGYGQCSEAEVQKVDTDTPVKSWWLVQEGGKELLLWGDMPGDEWALTYKTQEEISLWPGVALPFYGEIRTYQPQKTVVKNWSREEAIAEAKARAVQNIRQYMPPSSRLVQEQVVPLSDESGEHKVKVIWECIEDIALISQDAIIPIE